MKLSTKASVHPEMGYFQERYKKNDFVITLEPAPEELFLDFNGAKSRLLSHNKTHCRSSL